MDPVTGNIILILCFIVGSGLIILEAFIPGFGAAGIVGIILEVVAVTLTWINHGATTALIALFAVLLLIALAIFCSYRSAMNGRISKSPLVLKATESAGEAQPTETWMGKEGVAVTALRPGGLVEIGGTKLNAASTGDFIEKGAAIVVIGSEGDHLMIRRKT